MRVRVIRNGGCMGTAMAPVPSKGADKVLCFDCSTSAAHVLGPALKHLRVTQGLANRLEAGSMDAILGPR